MTGKVEVLSVNTFGNYSEPHLNGGYCFKLSGEGNDHYLKIAYADSGEKRNNLQLVQSMVLTAYVSEKILVDWGDEQPTCRVEGSNYSARWLENLKFEIRQG